MCLNRFAFARAALAAVLRSYLLSFAMMLVSPWTSQAAAPPTGVAPVLYPAGGFGIDGNLIANAPATNVGDWVLSTNAGTGGAVLTAAGVPLDPTRTFHFSDLYGSTSDNTFSGGKWTDNPTNWQWTLSKANSKTDINNVLLHTSTDADGHSWVIIAADRSSVSGASYIDFEFLQNSLVANSNGTFSSAGPNGGRTANDLLLNLAFVSGGSSVDFFAWRWMTNSSNGGFAYYDVTASFPTGRVFVAASSNGTSVPFGAFGNTTYAANQFAEAAVDLTALLGNFDPCLSIGFATILVKTKDSPSSSATISDFINPIKYSLRIGPSAIAGPDQTQCTQGDSTAFALQGQATPGLKPIVSTNWSIVAGSATIDEPTALNTTVHVSSATATLRLTVVQTNGCTESDDVVLNVAPLPACAIAGPSLVCPRSSTPFRGPSGMGAYSWSVVGNGSILGATNAQTVTVTAGTLCATNFTLQLTVTSNSCVSSCTTEVTVDDTTAPTITSIPANVTLQCASAVPAPNDGAVTATDNCTGPLVVTHSDLTIPGSCANSFVLQRTYTVTDSCGNSTNAIQTITVNDNTAPVISSIPTNVTVQCASAVPAPNDGAVVATDNCGGAPVITHSDQIVPGACANKFVVMRTYTATDLCGNNSSRTQTITVNDTNAPVIASIPANVTVQCAGDVPAADDSAVVATDNCGSAPVITHSDQITPGTCINKFVVKRTYTATDECGNAASRAQTITVSDTNAPVITSIPADVTVSCAGAVPPADHSAVVATDNCGGIPVITHSDQTNAGACVNKFVVKRTYAATDECGNRSSQIQTITVNDTNAPVISSIPADVMVQCASAVPAANDSAVVATDACGGIPVITHSDQTIPGTCPNKFVLKRTYTATDACGNSSSLVQTITVNDTTAPVISSIPADVTVQCASAVPAPNDAAVVATDNCAGAPVITHSDQTIAGACVNKFVVRRTYTATDACGNSGSLVQTITVNDTTAPVIASIPTNVTVSCAGAVPAPNDGGVIATDNCAGAPLITHSDQVVPGTCVNKFTLLRTYTATDICGNSSSRTQTITVNDTNLPVIVSIPTNVTVQCADAIPAPSDAAVVATDTCGGAPVISHSDQVVPGACANKFVVKRTYTATDACGNSSSMIQTITVSDTSAPVITSIPTDTTVLCASAVPAPNDSAVVAADACGGTPSITHSDQTIPGACANKFVVKRTYTATDACGNSSSQIQTITVNDTNAPVITSIPANVAVQCASAVPAPNDAAVVATDACGGAPVITHSDQTIPGTCANRFVLRRTYTATDACGNSSSQVQTIIVNDNTGPAISSIPADVTVPCATAIPAPNDSAVIATDNCGGAPVITHSDLTIPGSCPNKFVVQRTYTATDPCGNTNSRTQTITVNDNLAPALSIPADLTLECPANTTTNNTGVATAQDSCSLVTVSFSDSVNNGCGGAKVISRVWTATDACGNTTNRIQTITLRDTTRPTITVPPNVTLECGASTAPSATGTATAQDACSSVSITYSDSISNNCGGSRVISRTWTATDGCGNSASGLQTITVRDTTAPALRLPANVTLQCPGDTRTNVTGVPTVSDVCSAITVTYSDVVSNGCAATKTVWRTWTAVDACGNATNGVQTINVIDTTKPSISCPRIAVQCVDDIPAPYADLAAFLSAGGTATDSCSSALTFSQISDSGLVGRCPGTVTRVYRVTDTCGNFSDCTQTITVDDTIAPVLRCPTNLIVECGSSLEPASIGGATATDNCSTNVTITYNDAIVLGQYNLSFYVADPDTNTGPYAPTYLKFAPGSLPCPDSARQTGRALDPLRNAVAFAANGQLDALTSIGNVPMAFGQIVPFEVVIEASGGPGPERGTIEFTADWNTYTTSNNRFGYDTNYMVYCAFVDAADPGLLDPNYNARVESYSSVVVNRGSIDEAIRGTFRVSGLDAGDRVVVEIWVVLDSTMPDHSGGTVAASLVSARTVANPPMDITVGVQTDSLGNLSKIFPLPPPQPQPPLGPLPPQPPVLPGTTVSVIDRTWAATDDCGNRSTCVQRITVRDTTPPALLPPPDVVLDCPATDTSTNVTGVATAPDGCGGAVKIYYSDVVSNGCAGTRVISRTWTATDSSGLSTNATQIITVRDTTGPTLTCPPDRVLECPADTRTITTGIATAQDACSQVVISYSDIVSNTCGGSTITLRTWTATDECGNSTSSVQKIAVQDTTRPTLTCPPDLALECPADTSTSATGVAAAQDTCGQVVISYSDIVSNTCGGSYITFRTWTATDDCGNSASCVQKLTVRDASRPSLTCPPDLVLECPAGTTTNATGVATAQDTCGQVVVRYSDIVSNTCGGSTITLRTWTATDECGNSVNCVQKITVQDTTSPSLTCQPSRTVPANVSWNFDDPTTSDTCGAVTLQVLSTVTNRPDTSTLTATRTWLATDACGNTNTCQQTITVSLGRLPVISSFSKSRIVAEGSDLYLFVGVSSPTPCTYSWQLGGVPLAGGSGALCALRNVQLTNAGVYSVIVSNAAGAVGSPAAVIDVGAKISYESSSNRLNMAWSSPYILQTAFAVTGPWFDMGSPKSPFSVSTTSPKRFFRLRSPAMVFTTNLSGGQFSLSSPGVPGCNFIFQASTNQTDWLNLQTNPSPFMFIDSDAWQYPNRTYRAVIAQPIVNPAPAVPVSITAAPQGQTAALGGDMTLTTAATGSGPLAYQWQLNGVSIAGATGNSLNLSNLQFSNAGLYTVVVSNAAGVTTSAAAVVNVGASLAEQRVGSALQLTWPAPFLLQVSIAAGGPYVDLASATSPYLYNLASGPRRFFRLRSPPFQFTSGYLPTGEYTMSGPGVPGYNFVFQASTDLVNWINLQTNTSPVSFVDSNAAQFPNRTYRAIVAH